MKEKRFKKLIQGPLRFHHQDIHEELAKIHGLLDYVLAEIKQIRSELQSDYNDGKEDAIQAAAKIYSRGSGAGEVITGGDGHDQL